MAKRLLLMALLLLALTVHHALGAVANQPTIVTSSAQWRLLPSFSEGAFRLVAYTVSDATLCSECPKAEALVTSFASAGGDKNKNDSAASSSFVIVRCDEVAPGAAPCNTITAFPHIEGLTWAAKKASDDDAVSLEEAKAPRMGDGEDDEDDNTEALPSAVPTVSLDLSTASAVDAARVGGWLMTLSTVAADTTTSEAIAGVVAKASSSTTAATSSSSIRLHSFSPLVKNVIGKGLEAEMKKHAVAITIVTTAGCAKCAYPLYELEKVGKVLQQHDEQLLHKTVALRRVALDANIRADFGLDPATTDVPIILMWSSSVTCDASSSSSTPAAATSPNARWVGGCAPTIYYGSVAAADMISFIQREYGVAEGFSTTMPRAGTPSSALSAQINSLAAQKGQSSSSSSSSAHSVSAVFNAKSTAGEAAEWIANCKVSPRGCFIQLVANWYIPMYPLLQQHINTFVGASKVAAVGNKKQKTPINFAIADLTTVPNPVFEVLVDGLVGGLSSSAASITSFCPAGVCTYYIAGTESSSITTPLLLPQSMSIADFFVAIDASVLTDNDNDGKVGAATKLLVQGSRYHHIVAEGFGVRANGGIFAAPTDKLVATYTKNGQHLLTLFVPVNTRGAAAQQHIARQLVGFDNLCKSLNATDDANSISGVFRCLVVDANRPNHYDGKALKAANLPKTLKLFLSLGDDDTQTIRDVSNLLLTTPSTSNGGKTEDNITNSYEATMAFLRAPRLFEVAMCKVANTTCRPPTNIVTLKAGGFEATINDQEFAKFVLYGGGPSCPHTPILLRALERVARVHSKDRHEITVAFIDATTELSADLRTLYGIDTVPQLRYYARGTHANTNGVHVGELYTGPTIAEAIFEYLHYEMGYAYFDFDYRREVSITAVTARHFADNFVHDMAANKSHSVVFLYDSVISDRYTLDTLFALDRQHFNNASSDPSIKDKVDFYKMDGRQFTKLVTKHHLPAVAAITSASLPQLVFLPKGPNKLRKVMVYNRAERFTAVSIAEFALKAINSFEKKEKVPQLVTADPKVLFNFTADELRLQRSADEEKEIVGPDGVELVQSIGISNFKDFIAEQGDRVVLFYTLTCPHCKAFMPVFTKVASHFAGDNTIRFASINLQDHSEVGHVQGIQTIPTIKVYFHGSVDKTTEFRGEDYKGSTADASALIDYITSTRRSPRVAELDQIRALKDNAFPTLDNFTVLDRYIGAPDKSATLVHDYEPSFAAQSVVDSPVTIYDDKTFLAPTLLEVTMEFCGHCYHMNTVLLELDNYFRKNPQPRLSSETDDSSRIRFVKMDGNANPSLSSRFGITEFPALVLFYTKALTNGTMRHMSVKYGSHRNTNAVGEFLVKSMRGAIPQALLGNPPVDGNAQQRPPQTHAEAPTGNPFEDEAVDQQQRLKDEQDSAVFNESIPILNPRIIRTALVRTTAVVVMTYSLPRDQSFVMVMNELHKGLSEMPIFKEGRLQTGIFPEHLMTDEIAQLTGWSKDADRPYISLFRGMAQPQIVHLNQTSMKGIGTQPPADQADYFYSHATPELILQFLDKYAQNVFVLPRSLNETTFMQNMANISSPTGTLDRWAVLFTSYECQVCHKMLQSTSYSAQGQLTAHMPNVEVTVLDINRARRVYNQWGKPTLPALVVFERSTVVGSHEITSARVLEIEAHEKGEEELVVPKRRQVFEFIMGVGDHPTYTIRPSLGFRINSKAIIAKTTRRLKKGNDDLAATVVGDVISVSSASDLDHALKKVPAGAGALVIIRGEVCKSCDKIEEALATAVMASHVAAQDIQGIVKPLAFIKVQLPQRSRTMERELITMGFSQLSAPSVYIVTRGDDANGAAAGADKRAIVKFHGTKDNANAVFDFALEQLPK